jgi:hypothetical protein
MTDIVMRKGMAGLFPTDEAGENTLGDIKMGDAVKVKITRPRNIQHHRLFFAMCNLVANNTDAVRDTDELVFRLKIATGHCRELMRDDGTVLYEPQSISFASMSQDEFNDFYKKCVDIICTRLIPGMEREDLQNEVLAMVA